MAEDKKAEVQTAEVPKAPEPTPLPSPLEQMRTKAEGFGVSWTEADTIESLKEKIKLAQAPKVAEPAMTAAQSKAAFDQQMRQQIYTDNMFMVRVRITNMNPAKADLPGEIFTVSNKYLGTVRRFIPYGEMEEGWHVPKVILDMLQEKTFSQLKVVKGANGQLLPQTKAVKEFAIEILPPLTEEELRILANKQAAAQGLAV